MNKKILVITSIILLAIGGGVAYLLTSSEDKVAMKDMMSNEDTKMPESTPESTTSSQSELPQPASTTPVATPGAYVDYEEGIVAKTSGTKLLFFHAPWCPQCRDLEKDIKSSGVPSGVAIIKVDYDSNQGLRKNYGVTIQTTVVRVDDNGNLVKKFVAYDDPSIEAIKQNLL